MPALSCTCRLKASDLRKLVLVKLVQSMQMVMIQKQLMMMMVYGQKTKTTFDETYMHIITNKQNLFKHATTSY
jgi:hypothetical protein